MSFFFHFSSFSFILFVFVGCSKSDFLGASISLRFLSTVLNVKIQFFGTSRRGEGGTHLGPLFLFFLLFSSPVVSFFFLFIFFFIFQKKKFLLFLSSCISFKYVSLLALVSEFNCFLRSRCSMEMWCPDDLGRDGWDWVGPLTWERG